MKVVCGRFGEIIKRYAEDLCANRRGVGSVGGFIPFSAKRLWCQIRAVSFHQDTVQRSSGKDVAHFLRFGNVAMPDMDR